MADPKDVESTQGPIELSIDLDAGGDGRTRVVVRGELDASTAERLRDAVAETHEGEVALDLAGVTFLDSSGLAAIIEASLLLRSQGRSLSVSDRSEVVRRVLDLSGVDAHLGLAQP